MLNATFGEDLYDIKFSQSILNILTHIGYPTELSDRTQMSTPPVLRANLHNDGDIPALVPAKTKNSYNLISSTSPHHASILDDILPYDADSLYQVCHKT